MCLTDGARSKAMQKEILQFGGNRMADALRAALNEMTFTAGEACVVKAWGNVSANVLVPFAGPAYQPKFHRSAVRTLHNCIRDVLKLAVENNCVSVALPMSYDGPKNSFPREDAVHTILRTTRRWLEQLPSIETVVFFTDDIAVTETFGQLLPLYFPRSAFEARQAFTIVPPNFQSGNELGELDDDAALHMVHPPEHAEVETLDFAPFSASKDAGTARYSEKEAVYARYLEEAHQMRSEIWTMFQKQCFLYVTPPVKNDVFSLPMVTLIGANWPQNVRRELLMQYLVRVLDPVLRSGYSFLYVHASASYYSAPSLETLQEVLHMMHRRYKHSLKRFFILHPNWAVKAALAVGWAFMSSDMWNNTVYFDSIRDLEHYVQGKVKLPPFVAKCEQENKTL
eukprot:GEMP01023729.1.p1 GENE.GEMP01023729.1~~GEMP01023729.1.p1  ORF type:complete len:397 (+),score=85.65 GEMP01023729.1:584-1774(+)